MNGTEAFRLLRKIEKTASKNEKIALVGSPGDDTFWKKVLRYAYDPFITFGITPPKVETDGSMIIADVGDTAFFMLDELAARKLTGNEAKECVKEVLLQLDVENSELLRQILSKDLRAGFTDGTILKAYPGLFEVFEVMLAHKFEEHRVTYPVAAEPKLDGVRASALAENGSVELLSRTGKALGGIAHLSEPLWAVIVAARNRAFAEDKVDYFKMLTLGSAATEPSLFLDGEVMAGEFNKTSGDVRRKSVQATDALYHVFDAVPLAMFRGAKKIDLTYKQRRAFLEFIVASAPEGSPIRLGERYIVSSSEELHTLYNTVRSTPFYGKPGEGLVVKPLTGLYEKKRSHSWLKMKAEETIEMRVVGAFEGSGKYEGKLGGLKTVGVGDEAHLKADVGGGFSDAQRGDFWEAWELDTKTDEYRDAVGGPSGTFQLLNRLIEVEYHEKTPDNSLRHPRFVRFRDDKDKGE